MSALVLASILAAGASAPPPPGVVVLAGAPEYAALTQLEQSYAGRLRQSPDGFRLFVLDGLGRASNAVELHAPGKAHLLAPLLEQHVQLVGKVVPGTPAKLWPGRIVKPGRDGPGPDGVLARADLALRLGKAASASVMASVIRTPEQLAEHLGIAGPTAGETASKLIAARMGRASIDFRTQIIVKVDGGLAPWTRQVVITRAAKDGDTLTVSYARTARAGGSDGGFHNAGQMALVPRHEGRVEFRQAGADTLRR